MRDRIELLLADDLRISAFEVVASEDGLRVAVVAAEPWFSQRRQEAKERICARMLRQWGFVYDRSYRSLGEAKAPNFDVWISGFSNQVIPHPAMQAWLDGVMAQLRSVAHERVLDIGSGSGLVLAQIAPGGTVYEGLDLSEQSVASLGAWAATQGSLRHVRLSQGAAHDVEDRDGEPVDLVIMNSVAQYFPDADYLERVLQAAVKQSRAGASIFLGDLRALALLPMRAANVAAMRADPDASAQEVRTTARKILEATAELAIDPGFFQACRAHVRRIGHVQFSLKPRSADRDLAGYRYDALLRLDTPDLDPAPTLSAGSIEAIVAHLSAARPSSIAVLGLSNARLTRDAALAHALNSAPPDMQLGIVQQRADLVAREGIEPEDLAAAAEAVGYTTEQRFSPGAADGRFDALFSAIGETARWPSVSCTAPLTNDPLAIELAAQLRRELQTELENALGGVRLARFHLAPPRIAD